jgi:hypothetical protein
VIWTTFVDLKHGCSLCIDSFTYSAARYSWQTTTCQVSRVSPNLTRPGSGSDAFRHVEDFLTPRAKDGSLVSSKRPARSILRRIEG